MKDPKLDQDIANLPREIEPQRDLWPEIEARLEARLEARPGTPADMPPHRTPLSDMRCRPRRRLGGRTWLGGSALAMAASVLLYVGTQQLPGPADHAHAVDHATEDSRTSEAPKHTEHIGSPTGSIDLSTAGTTVSGSRGWQAEYETAAGLLEAIFDDRRLALAPTVVALMDDNLTLVDTAISQTRHALASSPQDAQLLALMHDAYQGKLDLLDQATSLPE